MMSPVNSLSQVYDAMQQVKAAATSYCTNFFPVQKKLQGWIDHGELLAETRGDAAAFLRKDRDFWHFYFCAGSAGALRNQMQSLDTLRQEPVVTDLVGNEAALGEVLEELESAGFRRYGRLQRMARSSLAGLPETKGEDAEVRNAEQGDARAILGLLEHAFDCYADQLPAVHEIEEAIAAGQILTIKRDGTLAALLFFETQGFTSTIRYWVVAEPFRSRRLGGVLMRHYLAGRPAVKRFVLWVVSANTDAVRKYEHYGYAADGLIDHVLANPMIRA